MEIFYHSSIWITKRCLGITQDDIDRVHLEIRLCGLLPLSKCSLSRVNQNESLCPGTEQ